MEKNPDNNTQDKEGKDKRVFFTLLTAIGLLISFYLIPVAIFISFIPLFWVCYKSESAFRQGAICGFIFSAGLLYWVLILEAPVQYWLWLGVFLLIIYFSLIFGLTMWFTVKFVPFPLIPIIWTSIEFLRGLSPEIGFPWGSIGYALIPPLFPYKTISLGELQFVQFAEFVGLHGITFFILLINTLLFYCIKKRQLKYLIVAIVILFCAWMQGYFAQIKASQSRGSKIIRVGIIQPNIAPEIKQAGNFDYRLNLLYRMSKSTGDCDLLVWPESAIPGYFNFENTETRVKSIVNSLNIPIVMGSSTLDLTVEPSRIYNSAFVVLPNNPVVGSHHKMYLVPFGERLPFTETFPGLQKLEFGQSNFSQGKEFKVFDLQGSKFSILICFESIFPRLSRRFVNYGTQFLVNITDDEWFGRSAAPYQHAQQAVLRAIEYRIPIVRCGNTGISYFANPTGKVESATKIFTQAVITKRIQLRDRFTFYAKWGDWFAWLCVGILFLFFNLKLIRPKVKA